ncbi:MAG: alpha/beta hydrolase [Bacteroidota bacterium]
MALSFNRTEITIAGLTAHYFQLNDEGDDAHFYPGSGLPVGVYGPLLERLSSHYQLSSLAIRASWRDARLPGPQIDWRIYAKDLIAFLEARYAKPIVAIAHSQGAHATLVAAVMRPDLFKQLILVDPVAVLKRDEVLISWIPYFVKRYFEPFKSVRLRQSTWDSVEQYYEYLSTHRAYKRIPPDKLRILAEYSLEATDNGSFRFVYPVAWEMASSALPRSLKQYFKQVTVPYTVIMGKPSLFSSQKVRDSWSRVMKSTMVVNEQYGHLIPLEAPEYCCEQIIHNVRAQGS